MNTVNLIDKRDFPFSTNAMKFIQEAYSQLEHIAKLGGDNYIISGCTVVGSAASNGWVVIGGKLMPFVGNTIQTNVRVITNVQVKTVGVGTREETTIWAEFGTSTNPAENVEWATLNSNRIETLLSVKSLITGLSSAIDTINASLGTTKQMVVNIGTWDMDNVASKIVELPTQIQQKEQILNVVAVIYSNGGTVAQLISRSNDSGVSNGYASFGTYGLGWAVTLYRTESGLFDQSGYGGTASNRGTLLITYRDAI